MQEGPFPLTHDTPLRVVGISNIEHGIPNRRSGFVDQKPGFGIAEKYNPWKELWGPTLNRANFDASFHGHTHKVAIHPPGTAGDHNYPVIIGGGKKSDDGTVTALLIDSKGIHVTLLNVRGENVGSYHSSENIS